MVGAGRITFLGADGAPALLSPATKIAILGTNTLHASENAFPDVGHPPPAPKNRFVGADHPQPPIQIGFQGRMG